MSILKINKENGFLLFLMVHIIIKNDLSHILILCMIENLSKFFLTYNRYILIKNNYIVGL
jgi:hypothetical protein